MPHKGLKKPTVTKRGIQKGGGLPDVSTPPGMLSWAFIFFILGTALFGITAWVLIYDKKELGKGKENDDVSKPNTSRPIADTISTANTVSTGTSLMPINIPTRGDPGAFVQIGLLTAEKTSDEDPFIMPLFGRKLYHRSDRWEYYAGADKVHVYKIPIFVNNRNCTDELGCDEIYEGDQVTIPTYGNRVFRATMYPRNELRYIPA